MAGKTIVLLADGTGNSAAKLFKTNVWRLYKALDLSDPPPAGQRQIAYYHDGVGTSTFKPLTILGGVFGVGLKRNVMHMYAFLCRNYRPGDRIYIYGFSRGAFTARVLASLIVTQGILSCANENELTRYAPDAYRRYRRRYKLPIFGYKDKTASIKNPEETKVGLVDRLRDLRDGVIWAWRKLRGTRQYEDVRPKDPDIKIDFVGVWDTVAAYGLPIDELTRGIDDWVWPLSMPNFALSPKVLQARHALALDDERDTFHPLLWDEVAEEKMIANGEAQKGRLKQIWFAGMHTNVGGGYADDSMSFGALEWMMTESQAAGLRFLPVNEREAPNPRDDFGTMYNSRSGLGSYYRYQPRKIAARLEHPDPTTLMMQDPNRNGVGYLKSVTIHESVWHRIQAGTDSYATIVVPDHFNVLKSDGTVEAKHLPLPVPPAGEKPVSRTEWVWNDVWRRRVNYFMTVLVSLALALLPLFHAIWPPSVCVGPQCVLAPIITSAGEVLPGFVQPWIRAFAISPGFSVLLAIAILLLLGRSAYLKRCINDGMRELWVPPTSFPPSTDAGKHPNGPHGGIYGLRSSRGYQKLFQWLKWRIFPGVFGFTVLVGSFVVAAIIILIGAQRAEIAWSERQNKYCQLTPLDAPVTETSAAVGKPFRTIDKCWASGMTVTKGERYVVTLRVTQPWVDGNIPTSPAGFESSRRPLLLRPSVLLRRSLSGHWFQPMLKIVSSRGRGGHVTLLDMRCNCGEGPVYSAEFEAARSGEVLLFVNDVMPLFFRDGWDFYENNKGEATVTIVRIPRRP